MDNYQLARDGKTLGAYPEDLLASLHAISLRDYDLMSF